MSGSPTAGQAGVPPRLTDLPAPPAGKVGWPWTETCAALPPLAPNGRLWPRISVVTPSYNQVEYLEETIRSVVLQGYPNLDYIVMDGGSTDGSRELIERYGPWLSYWQSQPDKGQSHAIARGFDRADGDILAWLNSDDVFRPEALARVARFFVQRPEVVFGSGDVNLTDSTGRIITRFFVTQPSYFITANLGIHHWPQQGCFWRRDAYVAVGGVNPALRFCMDRDLFLRITAFGRSARIPGKPLADFRQHEQAKTSTIWNVRNREAWELMQKYGHRRIRAHHGMLRLLWWAWHKPTKLRFLVQRRFGWEL